MKTEQPNRPRQPELFPTAGYGSVAPTWIKADLLAQTPASTAAGRRDTVNWHWLRRQLGWHQS